MPATATATASRTAPSATATAAAAATWPAAPAAAMHGPGAILRVPFLVHRRLQIARQQFRRHARHLDLVRDVVLDVRQRHRVFLAAEADGVTLGAGARRAANAMHVVGGVLRQVVVEHVA